MSSNDVFKQKILNEAIHGRLVENDLSLPPIEVEEITEDIPFEIPSNWKWVKFSSLGEITSSKRVFRSEWKTEGVPFYRARDIVALNKGKIISDLYISEEMYENYSKKYGIPQTGDILLTGVGTIGEAYIVKELDKFYFKDGNIIWFKNKWNINPLFLKKFFESNFFFQQINATAKGTTVLTLTITHANEVLIPIPPLEEQKKIVSKIEELYALIDKKEKNDKEKEQLKTILKDKILDDAIHGRLVENDLSLPPIEVEEITEDIPFEIPSNWKWCNYKNIGYSGVGLTYKPENVVEDGIIVLRSSNIQNGKLDLKDLVRVNCNVSNNIIVMKNDILICVRNGSKRLVGKSCLLENLKEKMTYGAFMTIFRTNYYKYTYWFMQSRQYYDQLYENTNTMTINQVTQKKLNSLIIPLPPIEEQKRIVSKIEELFALIDSL